ncbi:MAG: methyltransferase [Chloroflexi bacterium]|nr:methyltransferase [Chloroflexota bacterium]
MLVVATELGIADLLADGPQSAESLAATTGTHPRSLYRLLRTLASHGVFSERDDSRFELTPLAELLRVDSPGSMRATVLAEGSDFYPVWAELMHSVTTGETAFERVYGASNWEYRKHHPEANARFNAYMGDLMQQKLRVLLAHYHFPESGTIIDVGGNNGTLLSAILARYPAMRGVVFDQPHVVGSALPVIAAAGVSDRCTVERGDFFVAVPTGGDIYLLSHVLHDWGDEDAAAILQRCREAMTAGARLLIIERVMPAGNEPSVAKLRDIAMLLSNKGGQERTEPEWRALLDAGGFDLASVSPIGPAHHVLEGTPR